MWIYRYLPPPPAHCAHIGAPRFWYIGSPSQREESCVRRMTHQLPPATRVVGMRRTLAGPYQARAMVFFAPLRRRLQTSPDTRRKQAAAKLRGSQCARVRTSPDSDLARFRRGCAKTRPISYALHHHIRPLEGPCGRRAPRFLSGFLRQIPRTPKLRPILLERFPTIGDAPGGTGRIPLIYPTGVLPASLIHLARFFRGNYRRVSEYSIFP